MSIDSCLLVISIPLVGKPPSMSIYAGLRSIYAILLGGRFVGWHIIRLAPTQEGEISQTLLLYIYSQVAPLVPWLAKSPNLASWCSQDHGDRQLWCDLGRWKNDPTWEPQVWRWIDLENMGLNQQVVGILAIEMGISPTDFASGTPAVTSNSRNIEKQ